MKAITNLFWWIISWLLIFLFFYFLGFSFNNAFLSFFLLIFCVLFYYNFVFRNQEQRLKKVNLKLLDILMRDESIIVQGIDTRPFALFSRRQIFAVTNSRIIRLKRRLIGGFEMLDFQWKDLEDAQVSENVLSGLTGSTLTFKGNNGMLIEVYPELEIASKAYKHSQQEEQAWEEKRRIRDMEEKRAEAGGIMIGSNSNPIKSNQSEIKKENNVNQKIDIADELIKLKKLVDEGILSDAEFQEMKSKILSRSTQNF